MPSYYLLPWMLLAAACLISLLMQMQGKIMAAAAAAAEAPEAETFTAAAEADRITYLPGQPLNAKIRQFAGYVPVGKQRDRFMFYYFVEAEGNPKEKPLVLWLSGGPGCSSVGAGAFMEHGPFKPNGNWLKRNAYSWNKEANMLYLESPAGVGFSYSANTTYYALVTDAITAQDNLDFLEQWLDRFPQYKNQALLLAGESYAGHYVPQLAELILNSSSLRKQLKAILIGNPLLEFYTDFNSSSIFWWSHGLVSDSTFQLLTSVCTFSRYLKEYYDGKVSASCSQVIDTVVQEIGRDVDYYDVTLDICPSIPPFRIPGHQLSKEPDILTYARRAELKARKDASVPYKVDVCIQNEIVRYLNRKDVKKALHAKLVGVQNWSLCSNVLKYEMREKYLPTIDIVGKLLRSGIAAWVYSGDQDSIVSFIGTRMNVDNLARNLKLSTTKAYRSWLHRKQVGGWTQVYGNILTFATIRGASHIAPWTHPDRSLELFQAFTGNKPLTYE